MMDHERQPQNVRAAQICQIAHFLASWWRLGTLFWGQAALVWNGVVVVRQGTSIGYRCSHG